MKKITFSPMFEKKLKKIKKKDSRLYQRILKQLKIFSKNPKNNSLRLHKLEGELNDTWSVSVSKSIRLIFVEDSKYYFFDLGSHDQVYKS